MDITLIIAIALILLVFIGGGLIAFKKRRPKLSPQLYKKSVQSIQKTKDLDPAHSIMEGHKIFIKALQSLSETKMNAADSTRKIADYLPNAKQVWHYHRLRNQIAHETDIKVSKKQADDARNVWVKALGVFK